MTKLMDLLQKKLTSTDFKYWLQGAFEVGGLGIHQEISFDQRNLIEAHVNQVRDEQDVFCQWMKKTLDKNKTKISISVAAKIKKELSKEFIIITSQPDNIIIKRKNFKKQVTPTKYC